ncbi:hypothetical protein ANCCAN_04712 [Ancylostoma caninum]|uniref:Uncharacterized protein n=1 Tax=Ancylostoma caninum TaxID=29170 RepID=A0A368H1L3_ANCCA|nr:hypothetical protein ANCCAN_04712 [Ancylostoma caninum]
MTKSCEQGIFAESLPWTYNKINEGCHITETQVFSCACYEDLCSSNHTHIMEMWKKSPQYDITHLYTRCLVYIMDGDEDERGITFEAGGAAVMKGGHLLEHESIEDVGYVEMSARPSKYTYLTIVTFILSALHL